MPPRREVVLGQGSRLPVEHASVLLSFAKKTTDALSLLVLSNRGEEPGSFPYKNGTGRGLLSFTDTPLSDQTLRGPRDEPSLPECSLVNANNHLGAALNEGGNLVGARKLELNISLRFGSNCCLCLLHSSN